MLQMFGFLDLFVFKLWSVRQKPRDVTLSFHLWFLNAERMFHLCVADYRSTCDISRLLNLISDFWTFT